MNKLVEYLFAKKYLITFWIAIFLFIVTSYALSVWSGSLSYLIQIILFSFFALLIIFFFFALYLSIKTQKISYFANTSVTLLISFIAVLILNSQLGKTMTNQLLGNPITTAVFRDAHLNLRDNNSFDICYESSFVELKEIYSGTYQIKNNDILFSYKSNMPKHCSKTAKFEEDNRVIRFYDENGEHLYPFYIY